MNTSLEQFLVFDNKTDVRYNELSLHQDWVTDKSAKDNEEYNVRFDFPFDWPLTGGEDKCWKCMWLVHVVKIKDCLTQIQKKQLELSK